MSLLVRILNPDICLGHANQSEPDFDFKYDKKNYLFNQLIEIPYLTKNIERASIVATLASTKLVTTK